MPLYKAQLNLKENQNPLKILNEILQNLWLRKEGIERWNLEDDEEFLKKYKIELIKAYKKANLKEIPSLNKDAISQSLQASGIYDEVSPKEGENFEAALLLGATAYTFKIRLEYLINLVLQNIKVAKIYLLAGERPLDPAIEENTINEMKSKGISILNEAKMMEYLSEKIFLQYPHLKIEKKFITTPDQKIASGKLRRANTEDTLISFLDQNPKMRKILAISNAPYINYQNEIIKKVLIPKGFKVFTAGPKSKNNVLLSRDLDGIARVVYVKLKNQTLSYP